MLSISWTSHVDQWLHICSLMIKDYILYFSSSLCVCVCELCMYADASQGQEKAFGLLELELYTFVSHSTWLLELDLGSLQGQQAP